jgi:hypothetical protein
MPLNQSAGHGVKVDPIHARNFILHIWLVQNNLDKAFA